MNISDKLTGALWDRISGFFVTMWKDFWNVFIGGLEQMGIAIMQTFMTRPGYRAYLDLVNAVENNLNDLKLPDHVKKQIDTLSHGHNVSSATGSFVYMMLSEMSYLINVMPAMMGKEKLDLAKKYEPSPIDLSDLIVCYYRFPALQDYILEKGRENGLSAEDVGMIFEAGRSLLAPDELRQLLLRDKIDEGQVDATLKQHGYNDEDIGHLKELYYYIPPVQDLITMAVRECFDPQIIADYGQDLDFPPEFEAYAKKQGVSSEWAHHYWQAHWVLPSVRDGFEMVHRGVITYEDMKKLLRTQDVMPYWRDKLIKIAYQPYNRVDVRRMYDDNAITQDEVLKAYKDLGYDDDHAAKLTSWTTKRYGQDTTDYTKSEILNAYSENIISPGDCTSMLKTLGIKERAITLEMSLIDYKTAVTVEKEELYIIETKYEQGIINDTEVQDQLGRLDLPSTQIAYLLTKWDKKRQIGTKTLTMSEITKCYKANIITKEAYSTELTNLGYAKKYVDMLLKLNKPVSKKS